jgi:hypothetical protein
MVVNSPYVTDTAELSGLSRKVLMVKADDITAAAGSTLNSLMTERGLAELYKNRTLMAIDGEIAKTRSKYVYGVDYYLGDVVEIRNRDGETERMRVSEQIFSDDSNGEYSYPTLETDLFVPPGSWFSWEFATPWNSGTEPTLRTWAGASG